MTYSYFPGCTLKNKAKNLDESARAIAKSLDIELIELEEWQCCGGVYSMSRDDMATRLSSVRGLQNAHKLGRDLVTVCSACHNVIKQVNHDMNNDEYISSHINNYLGKEESYHGETKVYHLLEILRDVVGYDKIKEKIVSPLTDEKIGAYYGCLLLRPSKVMMTDNPENPSILEDLISAIGASPIRYASRNECCGGYMTLEDETFTAKRARKIIDDAVESGADTLITACPLCLFNLKKYADDRIEIIYFTEVLAKALGIDKEEAHV